VERRVWQGAAIEPDATALRAALSSPLPALRTAAARAVGRIAAPGALELLGPLLPLGSPDEESVEGGARRAALFALGSIADPRLWETLEALARSSEPAVRAEVARAAARQATRSEDAPEREAAASLLRRLLDDGDAGVRFAAALALGDAPRLDDAGALAASLAEEDDQRVRWAAVRALAASRERALPAARLLALLVLDGNFLAATHALSVLPELDGFQGLEETLVLARDPARFWLSRLAAVRALARWLERPDLPEPRRQAIETFFLEAASDLSREHLDPPALAAEVVSGLPLCRGGEASRRWLDFAAGAGERLAAAALDGLRPGSPVAGAAQPLERWRNDPRPRVELAWSRAAARLDGERGALAALGAVSPAVRAAAIEALEQPAPLALSRALSDPASEVQEAALGKLLVFPEVQVDARLVLALLEARQAPGEARLRNLALEWLSNAGAPIPSSLLPARGDLPGRLLQRLEEILALPRRPRLRLVVEGRGELLCDLFAAAAPHHIAALAELAAEGGFRGVRLRIADPLAGIEVAASATGVGAALAGLELPPEPGEHPIRRGTLIAPPWRPGAGRILIAALPRPELEGQATVLGQVILGTALLDRLEDGDFFEIAILFPPKNLEP
jgi:HEAT repeat protein